MKATILVALVLGACLTIGLAQDAKTSFDAGKQAGDAFGVSWAAGGAVGHPAAAVMPTIADGQWRQQGKGDETAWKKGFLEGFEAGLARGEAGEKAPIKAKDHAAYDAGFRGRIHLRSCAGKQSVAHSQAL